MSIVKKYKAEIVSVVNPISDIFTIEFRSLSGKFKYQPGQFLHLAIDEYDPSYEWPESRCFSIQSSPGNGLIKITYSIKGKFTLKMSEELSKGRIVDIKLPYGNLFQQDHSKEDVVFIAGGTGVTPFLSVFNDPSFSEYVNPILHFGVRDVNYNIYTQALNLAREINPGLSIEVRYENTDGLLNIDEIFKGKGLTATYFISGPRNMINTFKLRLIALGLNEHNVKTDEWE